MTLAEKILHKLEKLPKPVQTEVLDFVEFLNSRKKQDSEAMEKEWSAFSLSSAMRGMEDENIPEYDLPDLKEKFS
ncbi:MAG: DUF2281 domain-containing protein [Deltaproteobacteria bacterium]|nr:DUF2281 domain-containing protein [Deltaproteobacteria bacterium]